MASTARFTITSPALLALVMDRAVERVAVEVMRDARLYAPRSPRQPPPLDPSAPVTGTLKNSITMSRATRRGGDVVRQVGTSVHYGVYQEYGTRSIPARPYLGPALERARRKYGR